MEGTLRQPLPSANGHANLLTRLTPGHLADLRASGLSDQQIVACGFYSLRTPDAISQCLNWGRPAAGMGDALAIPFYDGDGKAINYCRLKCDNPRTNKKTGKASKYEAPRGSRNRAYFPPGTRASLKDPLAPLLMTEGEKKAAKADQEGFPTHRRHRRLGTGNRR